MKVLVFAPHPDDEIIGCGGSIAAHVENGSDVQVAFLTSGERAMSTLSIEENGKNREQEAARAANTLGISQLHFLRFPDTYIEITKETVEEVEQLLRTVQPEWIYITHAQETLSDHVAAHNLLMNALKIAARRTRTAQACHPKRVLAYEVWTPILRPHYIVDISNYMQCKLEALRMYQVELASRPYDQIAESLSRYRGLTLSTGSYAEVFEVLALSD